MINAFHKDIFREIKNTFGRFFAIFAIVLLGVAFYTGIGSTGLDMKVTGDRFFDEKNLMDIRVVSTYGINENDIAAIRNVEGVEAVYPVYNIDAIVNGGDAALIVKIHSVAAGDDSVNMPNLVYGRMPLADNEAVAEMGFAAALGIKIGDGFMLESGKKTDLRDTLKNVRYKLVGIVNSVYYVSNVERGPSSIGSGITHCFMYIPESNFLQNVYSEAFVTVGGARDFVCYGDEYGDLVKSVTDKLEALGDARVKERYIEATNGSYSNIAAAQADLTAAKKTAADEYGRLYSELNEAKSALESARRELIIKQGELSDGLSELRYMRDSLSGGVSALDEAYETALTRERELARSGFTIVEALAALSREAAGLVEKEALFRASYIDDPQSLSVYIGEIAAARAEITKTRGSLQNDLEAAYAGEAAAREVRNDLSARRAELVAELVDLESQRYTIDYEETEIIGGYASINRDINELDEQLKLLDEQEAESEKLTGESFSQLEAAKKVLDDLDKPQWYVTDRDANPGYSGFFADADKVEAIGRVFPFIFFVVAALVSLTTMTRFVDERRMEIGTLKSLGYPNFKIMSKYLIYAAVPTLLGGYFGGMIGMRFFPVVIIMAYQLLYAIPEPVIVYNTGFWTLGAALGTLSTLGATLAACTNTLSAPPWVLLRPRPPKSGARIFIERIKPLWNGFSFIWKVTIRNIVRYKKRFFMTVAGIAGCTALILTGFGLRDSIDTLIGLQYSEINLYDIIISFSDTAKITDIDAVDAMIEDSDIVHGYMPIRYKTYDAGSYSGGKSAISVNLVVPSEAETYNNFTNLRDRLTRENKTITENEVLITEKLALLLNVKRGDVFYIESGGKRYDVTVGDITENYYLHYVFMHKNLYEALHGEKPENNTTYILLGPHTDKEEYSLASGILGKKGVGAVFLTSVIYSSFKQVLGSLNSVIYVLILSAAALAVVVLMNLTNINISERKRELATIEVLGFYDNETVAYIYRENTVITLIGIAAGLLLGIYMHAFLVQTAETDMLMFGRQIKRESYIYSVLLTFLFASAVNILTGWRLRKINMVEALKNIE